MLMTKTRIYLLGLLCSGKTTLGKHLASYLDYQFVDMDAMIEDKEGKTIPDIFATEGKGYFQKVEQEILINTLDLENAVISTGGGAPCFSDNMEVINQHGTSIFIDVDPEEIVRRLNLPKGTEHRPLLQGKEEDALLKEIRDKLEHHRPFYEQAHGHIEGNSLHVNDLINWVKHHK